MNKVNFNLEDQDGNAFALIGAFNREARRAGLSKEEINEINNEATNGDYDHLIRTLMKYCA